MSRTFKFTLAASIALAIGAQAQDRGPERDLLSDLMAGMETGPGTSQASALRGQIEDRIQEIMSGLSSPESVARDGDPITIQEIDRINRSAERERTALEFEQAKFERMQLELQRLMALYEAVKTIETDAVEARSERQALLMEEAAETEEEQEETGPTALEMDQESLPRVAYINGMAGNFSVELESQSGSSRYYSRGDLTEDGFEVEKIEPGYVLLRGPASRTTFRVGPRAPKPDPRGMQGNSQIPGVIDLSQIPMAQF